MNASDGVVIKKPLADHSNHDVNKKQNVYHPFKTGTKQPTTMPTWARVTMIGLYLCLFGYMIHTQQNLNFYLLCGRFNQLVLLPLISLREGGVHLTSAEYNIQTHTILAFVTYTIALYILSLPTNPLSGYMNGKTKEYVALGFVSGFKSVDKLFFNLYCTPLTDSWHSTFDMVEESLSMPVLLGLMFVVQYGGFDPRYSTLLGAYFLIKWVRSVLEYQRASNMTSETIPVETPFTTTVAKSLKPSDSTTRGRDIWHIYGNTYDMTDYVAHHPGGKEAILLGANREDSTALFQSYHAFNIQKAKTVLEKYRISELSADVKEQLTSCKHENDPFYEELSQRVMKALRDAGLDPVKDRAGTWARWSYYAFMVSLSMTCCYFHCSGYLLGSFAFGICGALLGACIGHDGGHYSVSRVPFINDMAVWGTSFIANPIIWQHQHTYAHHSFTNDDDHDPDLHHTHPFYRMSEAVPLLPVYKRQARVLYILTIYLLTTFGTCFVYSFRFMIERSLHGAVDWSDRKRIGRSFLLWLHLIFYSTVNLVVPFFVHESAWTAFFAGMIPILTSGFYFAMLSQVGHITEACMIRNPVLAAERRRGTAKHSWAADQIETTNDFCPQSTLHFYVGGHLGLQIEHHLFPSLNHQHLHIIQPIVEQTAKEFNVDYKKYDSYSAVFWEQIKYLRKLANADYGAVHAKQS